MFDFDNAPWAKIEASYESYSKQYDKMARTLAKRGDQPFSDKYSYDEYFDQWMLAHDEDARAIGVSKSFPRDIASKQMYQTTAAQARALAKGLIEQGYTQQGLSSLKLDIRRGNFEFAGKPVWQAIKDQRNAWIQEALKDGRTMEDAKAYASAMVSSYFFGSPD